MQANEIEVTYGVSDHDVEIERLRAENRNAGDTLSLLATTLGTMNSSREALLFGIEELKARAARAAASSAKERHGLTHVVSRLMVILDCRSADHLISRASSVMDELRSSRRP
jgi:hypothetical protein